MAISLGGINPLTAYELHRPQMQTGDIILFSGTGPISRIIQFSSVSQWSHVGMVVRIKNPDTVLLWESTTFSKVPDTKTGLLHRGVALVPLRDRLATCGAKRVVWRSLQARITSDQENALQDLRRELHGREYEDSYLQLVRSLAGDSWLGNREEDLQSLFCSELVAEAYQTLGLLSDSRASNAYVPADFSTERALRLTRGKLGGDELILSRSL